LLFVVSVGFFNRNQVRRLARAFQNKLTPSKPTICAVNPAATKATKRRGRAKLPAAQEDKAPQDTRCTKLQILNIEKGRDSLFFCPCSNQRDSTSDSGSGSDSDNDSASENVLPVDLQ
jgi:hypothetical protein